MENGYVDDGSVMVMYFVNIIEDVSSNMIGFENWLKFYILNEKV